MALEWRACLVVAGMMDDLVEWPDQTHRVHRRQPQRWLSGHALVALAVGCGALASPSRFPG